MKTITQALIILFLFSSNFAIANPLIRVKEVGILIEELSDAAKSCSITEDFLDASIRIPLSNSRIKISSDILNPSYIYLNIVAINDGSFCILYINTSYKKWVSEEKASATFWQKGEIISMKKVNIQKVTGEIVESHIKQFISAWLKANQN